MSGFPRGITKLTSTGGTVTITAPQGPVTNLEETSSASVTSFNTRTGAVVLTAADLSSVTTGTPDPYTGSGATITATVLELDKGSDGSPITTSGPLMRVARVESLLASAIGGSGTNLTNEANAAGVFLSTGSGSGAAGTYMQTNAIFAYANATGAGTWDACAINAVGRTSGASTRRGGAAYLEGRTDSVGGLIIGCEVRANNQKSSNVGGDSTYLTTGGSNTAGLFVSASAAATANPTIAAGIQIYSADGVGGFGVGVGVLSASSAAFRDDSSAATSVLINGTHSGYGIDMNAGTFTTAVMRLPNAGKIAWRNAAGNGDLLPLYFDSSNRLVFDNNQDPNAGILISNLTHIQFSTGTGTKFGTGTGQKIGFWNTTPTAQPAGTTDVLASLVTIGLRAASSNPPLNLGTGLVTAGGTNLAGGAGVSTPTLGAAAQLAQTTNDAMIYIDITGAATGFAIKIGPTSGVANTLTTGASPSLGALYTVRLPAGWFIAVTSTTGSWTSVAVTC
jgi:hypothetical protein